ncbi:MAG: glycosyltransferase [Planctomycetaceae bacterium]|nr:glycosyltransferase [Planctomycetaceae bacterium]
MDLTVVIPQRGKIELTLDCLASMRRVESKLWPVVIVDDGSSDEERERFNYLKPKGVRFISQPGFGVTSAWNLGALHVCTETVLFLNNDVLFHQPAIELLLEPLRQREACLTGVRSRCESIVPKKLFPDGEAMKFLEGWAFACRVDDYYRIGGFDEQFELYYSDTDFQLRMMEEYGTAGIRVVDDVGLEHLGHRTAHAQPVHRQLWRRDRELFLQKWKHSRSNDDDVAVIANL